MKSIISQIKGERYWEVWTERYFR